LESMPVSFSRMYTSELSAKEEPFLKGIARHETASFARIILPNKRGITWHTGENHTHQRPNSIPSRVGQSARRCWPGRSCLSRGTCTCRERLGRQTGCEPSRPLNVGYNERGRQLRRPYSSHSPLGKTSVSGTFRSSCPSASAITKQSGVSFLDPLTASATISRARC
jgi:hypothetical protein